MVDNQKRMLEGFANYKNVDPVDHSTIGVPPGTRLMRIDRLPYGWRIWTATRDFIYGTFVELNNNGRVTTYVSRVDDADEVIDVRPTDESIRGAAAKLRRLPREGL